MKVTNEQVLQLLQLEMGDVIKSKDLKNYCDGIEFWKVSKGFLDEAFRLYPLYKSNTENPFNSGGISLSLLIGLEFEKVNDTKEIKLIKDMKFSECYELFFFKDELQELKPFFVLCDNLIAIEQDATMQDALNSLCEELPASTLITQAFQKLINKPYYYNENGDDYEPRTTK